MNNKMSKLLAIVLCVVMMLSSVAAVTADSLSGDADTPPAETAAPAESTPSADPTDPAEEPSETDGEEPPESGNEDSAPAGELVCTCEATEEEKAAEDFQHREGCPLYAAPVDANAELYEKLMACSNMSEVNSTIEAYPNVNMQDFFVNLTAEQYSTLMNALCLLAGDVSGALSLDIISGPGAGPLLPPVAARATIKMRMAPAVLNANDNSDVDESGVILSKDTEKTEDGYKITLETYVTGNVKISTEQEAVPTDIVLVLDTSGSMDEHIAVGSKNDQSELDTTLGKTSGYYQIEYPVTGWHDLRYNTESGKWEYYYWPSWREVEDSWFGSTIGIKKITALKTATTTFINSVYTKSLGDDGIPATNDDVDHRISIVEFSNGATTLKGLTSVQTGKNDLISAISNLTAAGSTYADDGMANAEAVLNGIPDNRQSNRVVIMFTDGEPNHGSGFSESTANTTIATSGRIKANGATVYTVGVFKDANASVPMPGNASNFDKYMNYVSSNFKNAVSMNAPGSSTYPETGSYYLAAGDAAGLNSVFQSIANEIQTGGASMTLGTETEVRDIVSPYFTMPENAESISVYTAEYTGRDADGNRTFGEKVKFDDANVTIDQETKAVSVTNFDFSSDANCVTDTDTNGTVSYSGRKLIIEFTVKPVDGFLGGNSVPTNGEASGVYKDGNVVENFPVPTVDVPINYNVAVADKEIYLGEKADLTDAFITSSTTVNGTNNAYVNIVYTLIDDQGKTLATKTITAGSATDPGWTWVEDVDQTPYLKEDTKYNLSCSVSPSIEKENGVANWDKSLEASVKVQTCTLTLTKSMEGSTGEVFIFTVKGANLEGCEYADEINMTVPVEAGKSVELSGLPVGTYTVTEDTGWAWNYDASYSSTDHVTFQRSENASSLLPVLTAQVTVTNTPKDDSGWFTGEAYKQNIFNALVA